MLEKRIKVGHVVFATEALEGSVFENRVVLIVNSNEVDGCFGFVVNDPAHFPLREVFDPIPAGVARRERQFFVGGPVDDDELFMLERGNEFDNRGGDLVSEGVYFGGEWSEISDFVDAPEEDLLLCLGYSGWTVNQLEGEIAEGSWTLHRTLDVASLLDGFQQKKILGRSNIVNHLTLCEK